MSTSIPEEEQMDLTKSQFRPTVLQKTSPQTIKLVVGGILVFIILAIVFFYQSKLTSQSKDIEQLNDKLGNMKEFEATIKDKMVATEKQFKEHIRKENKIKAESEYLLTKIPKTTTATQNATPYLYKPDVRPNDRPKPEYLNPELQSISKFRTQKSGSLPIVSGTKSEVTFFKTDSEGKTIDHVIYKSDETRKSRVSYYFKRVNFVENKKKFQNLQLIKYNEDIDKSLQEERNRVESVEYNRVEELHNLTEVTTELPMCVVVSGYSTALPFGIQYNLNSIFTQNYTNYFVVIFNDQQTGASDQIFRKYLSFHNISKQRYIYLENFVKRPALEYLYIASHYYCSQDSILVTVEGDAEFIGKNVLSMYNAGYQVLKAGVVYSNFYLYQSGKAIYSGFTSDDMIEGSQHSVSLFSHLMSYKTSLFRKLSLKDLQDDKGQFFLIKDDFVLFFPLMRLACGRVNAIDGYHYLFNINTGAKDIGADLNKIPKNEKSERNKKYTCDKAFDEMMKD